MGVEERRKGREKNWVGEMMTEMNSKDEGHAHVIRVKFYLD